MELNYCRRCGAHFNLQDKHVARCENGHAIYTNPAPCIGLFLFDGEDTLVMGVRGVEPNKGTYDAIGGFLERGENFEQALERETLEELGLTSSDYSQPTYLTSASSTYEFDGETHIVVSSFFYATLSPGAVPKASDDVAAIERIPIDELSVDTIGNEDIKQGFLALRKLRGLS